MFVTTAHAHTAVEHTVFDHQSPFLAQAAGGGDFLMTILPFIMVFVILYFLMIRPQRKQMKERQAMLAAIRRNDTVITGGGIIGKVTKVINDHELEIEIAKDTRIKTMIHLIADVRVKGEAAAARKATSKTPAVKKTAEKK